MPRTFKVVVERDEDGWLVGAVPELPGCHTQARTMEDLRVRIREAIELYLLDATPPVGEAGFVEVIEVSV